FCHRAIEDAVRRLHWPGGWKLAIRFLEVVKDSETPINAEAVDRTTPVRVVAILVSSIIGSAIQISVAALDQYRVRLIRRAVEVVQDHKPSRGSYAEERAVVRGSSTVRRPVKSSIAPKNQPALRKHAIGPIEGVKISERATRRDPEYISRFLSTL